MGLEITVNNSEEFQELVDRRDSRISKAIVDGILKNIKTSKKHIHVLSVNCMEEGEIIDITADRDNFIDILQENLPVYEREEWYEDCQRIVDSIKLLKIKPVVKKRGRPKKDSN
jgi:hypothetical protein